MNKDFIVRYFLAIAQTATALFFCQLCALLSFCILSIFLSISSASAQFLSDGVTPVTPIPSNTVFTTAITNCLAESPVTGICPIYGDSSTYGDIKNWDTSLVTDMGSAFARRANFNGDISGWDTSAVTSMGYLFDSASAFNQDISQWQTFNVMDMTRMFFGASAFDHEIRGWDVSNVANFTNIFDGATAFAAKYGTAPAFAITPTAAFFTLSSDAPLSALTLSQGSLSPSFTSGTLAYTASVSNSVSSLVVTPTVNDANATATVNGASPATPVTLTVGSNTVTVQVTAQDGSTQSYTVAVTRAAALTVALTGLLVRSLGLSLSRQPCPARS